MGNGIQRKAQTKKGVLRKGLCTINANHQEQKYKRERYSMGKLFTTFRDRLLEMQNGKLLVKNNGTQREGEINDLGPS